MPTIRAKSWVVYRAPVPGRAQPLTAVCEQAEWERMWAERPGYYTLVRYGIGTEGEAERLARGTAGDTPPRAPRARAMVLMSVSGGPPEKMFCPPRPKGGPGAVGPH